MSTDRKRADSECAGGMINTMGGMINTMGGMINTTGIQTERAVAVKLLTKESLGNIENLSGIE